MGFHKCFISQGGKYFFFQFQEQKVTYEGKKKKKHILQCCSRSLSSGEKGSHFPWTATTHSPQVNFPPTNEVGGEVPCARRAAWLPISLGTVPILWSRKLQAAVRKLRLALCCSTEGRWRGTGGLRSTTASSTVPPQDKIAVNTGRARSGATLLGS